MDIQSLTTSYSPSAAAYRASQSAEKASTQEAAATETQAAASKSTTESQETNEAPRPVKNASGQMTGTLLNVTA